MMIRTTIFLLGGLLVGAAALAATPPVAEAPREDTLGIGRVGAPSVATTQSPTGTPAPANSAGTPNANPSNGNPLWAIPLSQLRATRERPLFAPSRRPPPPVVAYQLASAPPPAPPKPAEPEKPRLSLVGTIAAGAEGIGVFLDSTNGTALRLKTGEAHDGWVLREVHRSEAKLQKGFQFAILTLPKPDLKKVGLPLPGAPAPAPRKASLNKAGEQTDRAAAPAASPPNSPASLALPIANAPPLTGAAPLAFPAPDFSQDVTGNPLMQRRRNRD